MADGETDTVVTAEPAQNIAPPATSLRQAREESGNFFDTFDKDEDAAEPSIVDRFRINQTESYYRGTLKGSMELSALASVARRIDEKDISPGQKAWRQEQKDKYEGIVADLAHYDTIRPWGTTFEGAAALTGQFAGGMQSPESFLGWGAKGSTMLIRTLKSGAQQGAIQAATDPVVQAFDIHAGVQKKYEPLRTVLSAGMGVVVGGGLHIGGELLSNGKVRAIHGDMAKEDVSFRSNVSEPVPGSTSQTTIDINGQWTVIRDGEVIASPEQREAAMMPAKDQQGNTDPMAETHQAWAREFQDWSVKAAFGPDTVNSSAVRARMHESNPEVQAAAAKVRELTDQVNEYVMSQEYRPTPPDLAAELQSAQSHLRAVEKAARRAIQSLSEPLSLEIEKDRLLRPDGDSALIPEGEQAAIAQRQSGPGRLNAEQTRPAAGIAGGTAVAPTPAAGAGAAPPGGAQAGGAAAAPNPRTGAIISLQQQSMALAEALGFPIRQGRITIPNALGVFKQGSGVVRVKEIPDFEVLAHEAGHAIEAKAGASLTSLTNLHAAELAPLVSNPAAYNPAQHVTEGFAEFIRRYIGNPAHAQNVAPNFTMAFRQFMGVNHPQMLNAIDDASAAYHAYLNAPSADAIHSVIRSKDEDPDGFRGVIKSIRDDGLPAVTRSVFMRSYEALLDHYSPVARAVREMGAAIKQQTGQLVELKAADNPEVLIRLYGRSKQAAIHDMMDGVYGYHGVTPQGPSLSGALELATGGMNSGGWGKWDPVKKSLFSDYLVARRADWLWDKFNRGDLANPPVAFSQADARTAMAEIDAAMPTFRQASAMVHGWTRELLKKQFDGGLISRDTYDALLTEQFYVPFMRDMSDKPKASGGGSSAGPDSPRTAETVKRMRGSSRDIKDPLESLMMQAFLVNRAIQQNDLVRAFVRLSDRAGIEGGRYVEKIPAMEAKKYTFDLGDAIERKALEAGMSIHDARTLTGMVSNVIGEDPLMGQFFRMEPAGPRGEPIVFYKEGGELKAARFMSSEEGHGLYELLTTMPEKLTDVFSELVAATSSIARTGIITNPTFAISNYIRDQFATAILRSDYIPIVSGMSGIKQEFVQGEAARLYAVGGGMSAGSSIAPVERAVAAEVDALAKKGYLVNRLTSFQGALELVSFTEAGTRNSVFAKVYDAKRTQGLSEYEAMIEAAYQATDVLDFSRHGSHTDAVRRYVPFLNAHLQGLDKARRTMVDPLIHAMRDRQVFANDPEAMRNALMAWVKVGGVGAVLGAGWAALNAESEAYRDASPQLKGTHVIIPIGKRVLLVPKPFELSLGFTLGEYAYQRLAQDDPRAAEMLMHAAYDVIAPPNPITDIPFIRTPIELKTGVSLFTGRDIVPQQLQRLLPEEQYTERTSTLAKTLGGAIGVSPIKVDYAIGNMFGTWGRDAMTLSSGVDERNPAQNWEDYVFLRRFIKDPGRTSDVTTKYWKFMAMTTGKFNQDVATYDSMVKAYRDDDARTFLNRLPESERAFVIMKSASREDGRAAFSANEKRLHPLQRSYDAVTLLNGLRRELNSNAFRSFETGQALSLTPVERRDLMDGIRELSQIEMRNAFVIMKEPGYANRALIAPQTAMDKIKALSPAVADEVATRYATSKIYPTQAVATAYPRLQRALIQNGSEADIGALTFEASADGTEFGSDRVKKPPKRRMVIEGAAAARAP